MKIKKITAFFLSFVLMLNFIATTIPVSAETADKTTYVHSNYTVEYAVTSEWSGNQCVEITVTNIGSETISNWSVGYNAHGEITGLWDARVYASQGTEYIMVGANHNKNIEAGKSIKFGYILKGNDFKIPQYIANYSKRVDVSGNYDVYYNITGDYGDTYQAEMVITNRSESDILAWELNFDGNATIDNLGEQHLRKIKTDNLKLRALKTTTF